VVASLAATTAVAVSPSLAASSKTHVIRAQNIAYTPERLVVHRGDRVTWEFLDAKLLSPHTVTSVGSQRFKDSPIGRLTGSFTATFAKRGTYKFVCTIHPASMSGVIIVR
jgi:plastocyanin